MKRAGPRFFYYGDRRLVPRKRKDPGRVVVTEYIYKSGLLAKGLKKIVIKFTFELIDDSKKGAIHVRYHRLTYWLPRSQIRYKRFPTSHDLIECEVPEWLAKKKGLV